MSTSSPSLLDNLLYSQMPHLLLPVDLYLPILDHIKDKNDLLSLCHVSSDWHASASLKLYSCVEGLDRQIKRQSRFFRTMCQSPHLALLVKECNMEFLHPLPQEPKEWDLIRTALRAMKHLQVLTIRAINTHDIALLMADCPFRLRRLRWRSLGGSEKSVLHVLSQQIDLVELDLMFNQSTMLSSTIPASTCPNLTTLCGSRATMEAFLPNHRITTLEWSPEFDESDEPLYDLHESFCHLRVLCLDGKWFRPRLHSIVPHLRSLEVLRLTHVWPDEKSCIGILTKLRYLVLSRHTMIQPRSSMVDSFFSSNPTLEVIFIQLPFYDGKDLGLYQQWLRSTPNHPVVSRGEVLKWTSATPGKLWD